MSGVKVIQADRDRAQAMASKLTRYTGTGITDGECDGHFLVQEFAATRTAALEQAAKVAERLKREVPYEYNQHPCTTTMRRIATAIRALGA